MDRLTSMAVFVRAVELGSFAATAKAMAMSAPMVGKHVRHLEDRLGIPLLHRTTRWQSLTDFGRAYYERCRLVLAEAAAADELAAEQLGEPRGTLAVTMPALLGRHLAAPVLLDLTRRHAGLGLRLSMTDKFDDLEGGEFDLAIRTGPLPDSADLAAKRLGQQQMIVCAAPAYVERRGAPRTIGDIGTHDGLVYRRTGRIAPWLFPLEDDRPVEQLPITRIQLDDMAAIAEAASDGMGLAWLPGWLVRDRLAAGSLVRVLGEQPPYRYGCHAVWLRSSRLPLKIRIAIDALAAALPNLCDPLLP